MSQKLTVIGDSLLDVDIRGEVNRICPDAPAPVFEEAGARRRAGGAALAATMLAQRGYAVRLVTAIGDDDAGELLRGLIVASNVELLELPYQGGTAEKTRLHTGQQVLLRLDRSGAVEPAGPPGDEALLAVETADAVLVSDYGRGVTAVNETRRVLASTASMKPVVWDPHPRSPGPVPGMRLVTPNEGELPAARPARGASRFQSLTEHGAHARLSWRAAAIAVTLGAEGAMVFDGSVMPMVISPSLVSHGNGCGAGDMFAGVAATALAGGALTSEAVQLAVESASAYVAAGGAWTAEEPEPKQETASELAQRIWAAGGRVVATGGCFDLLHTGHLATLRAARALGDCLIVYLNSDRSVRQLKGPQRPVNSQADRAALLGALDCVDGVVIFDEPTPAAALEQLRPDIWVKGGDYSMPGDPRQSMPEAGHVERWGGQCVVVPYVQGRSTTGLIEVMGGKRSIS